MLWWGYISCSLLLWQVGAEVGIYKLFPLVVAGGGGGGCCGGDI